MLQVKRRKARTDKDHVCLPSKGCTRRWLQDCAYCSPQCHSRPLYVIRLILLALLIYSSVTTAVFSTCGMGIFVFSIAAILSMPKQFITVYLGVILAQSNTGKFWFTRIVSVLTLFVGVKDKKSTIISDVVLAVTFVITVAAMWYILRAMNKVKPQVIYERRKARLVLKW